MTIEDTAKKVVEVTAKKVDDAIKQGLEQLDASLDEVHVEVLESGGFLRKAKVRLTLERETTEDKQAQPKEEAKSEKSKEHAEHKQERTQAEKPQKKQPEDKPAAPKPEQPKKPQAEKKQEKPAAPKPKKKPEPPQAEEAKEQSVPEGNTDKTETEAAPRAVNSEEVKKAIAHATEFIDGLIKKMGFDEATVEAKENGDVDITAPAGDDSLIIGRHGETLSAISFLAETLGRAEKHHVNIVADCNGYRERRAASLTSMAKRRANECAAKHRKIKLEPMERVDRRTIHNALSGDDRVTTVSEGKEPYRYIVILPKKKGQ